MSLSLFSICYVYEPRRFPKKGGEGEYLLQTFKVFSGIDRGYPQFVTEDIFVQDGQEPLSVGYCVVLFVSGRKPGAYVPKFLYSVPEARLEEYMKLLYYGPGSSRALSSVLPDDGSSVYTSGPVVM